MKINNRVLWFTYNQLRWCCFSSVSLGKRHHRNQSFGNLTLVLCLCLWFPSCYFHIYVNFQCQHIYIKNKTFITAQVTFRFLPDTSYISVSWFIHINPKKTPNIDNQDAFANLPGHAIVKLSNLAVKTSRATKRFQQPYPLSLDIQSGVKKSINFLMRAMKP